MSLRWKETSDRARTLLAKGEAFEQLDEWRIGTVTTTRIEPWICSFSNHKGEQWYRVIVDCSYQMTAHCPTIDRAIEMAMIFEDEIPRLWREYGWPSWRTKYSLDGKACNCPCCRKVAA